MLEDKPFSQACENNKNAILAELKQYFAPCKQVLEIGSGTGQHAVHFAASLPHLVWQCSDQAHYHDGINRWIDDNPSSNLRRPFSLTIGVDEWPKPIFDGIFTANTAHIMQKHQVQLMMQSVAKALPAGGRFCQYGPFTDKQIFSSPSNQAFHNKLVAEGYGGYRDIEELRAWSNCLQLTNIIDMPANNLLLLWEKF